MIEKVKEWLAKKAGEDKELKAKMKEAGEYDSNLQGYIVEMAREMLSGKNGYVEDSTVYNWAYDFFHDEEFKKEHSAAKARVEAPKDADEIPNEEIKPQPAKKDKKQCNDVYEGLSLFDI